MKKDTYKTNVVFRIFPDKQILALFPYEINPYNGFVNSYMHIGQHSEADYKGCVKITKPANEKEYVNLFNELENIGYNLNVIKRRNAK